MYCNDTTFRITGSITMKLKYPFTYLLHSRYGNRLAISSHALLAKVKNNQFTYKAH